MMQLRNPIILVALVMVIWTVGAAVQAQATFDRSTLAIETLGESHEFVIELALTPAQQAQGLMFRREMAPDGGMLFYHRRDTVATMWMRNTFLPLDMLFVAADGRIVHIVERTVPQSLTTISAGKPVRAVLELNAGTVRRLAIRAGDRLVHPLFGNAD
jgi:uncharacterized membrane protein (UPF0127 family)